MKSMADAVDLLTPDEIEKLPSPDLLRDWQGKATSSLDAQIEGLHSNWQQIVNGYVAYQKRTLPGSALPKRDR